MLPATPLANELLPTPAPQERFPLYLCQCNKCGHVQLPVQVDPKRLFSDYQYQAGTSPVFRQHLHDLAQDTLKLLPESNFSDLVVDIGSNDGTLLSFIGDGRIRRLGIEPAVNLAAKAQVPTWNAFWTKALAEQMVATEGEASLIFATNVFAHVKDIEDFTAGVALALRHGGLFVFEVGWLVDIVEQGHFDVVYHEHLDYHQVRCLVPFLARHGLHVTDAEHVDSQGGSLRVFAKKAGFGPNESECWKVPPVQQAIEFEEHINVRSLPQTMMKTCGELRRALDEAPRPVVGYGCPAKFTTLAYAAGVTKKDCPVIYEDNPLKVGRYTPGLGIPIRPTAELFQGDPPATIVIWAWNFADDIMRRCRKHGFKGRFIVPMPRVRICES